MRPVCLLTVLLVACQAKVARVDSASARANARPTAADSGSVPLGGPTIIAFYPRATQAQVDSSTDLATVLDDFSYHLSTASDSLRKLGFVIVERPHGAIHLVNGTSSRDVVPSVDSVDVGYIFAAPGHQDRISYGVMTNSDLIDAARAFLGLASRPPA